MYFDFIFDRINVSLLNPAQGSTDGHWSRLRISTPHQSFKLSLRWSHDQKACGKPRKRNNQRTWKMFDWGTDVLWGAEEMTRKVSVKWEWNGRRISHFFVTTQNQSKNVTRISISFAQILNQGVVSRSEIEEIYLRNDPS